MPVVEESRATTKRRLHAWSLPNLLTYFRILVIPLLVACFYAEGAVWHWVGFSLFVLAAVSDFFDGYLARLWQQQSPIGQMADPIADKVLVVIALLLLCWTGTIGGWSLIATMVIAAREIIVSGLREFLANARVSLPVTGLAKCKTVVQMVSLAFLLIGQEADQLFELSVSVLQIGHGLLWLAATVTFYTGSVYGIAVIRYIRENSE